MHSPRPWAQRYKQQEKSGQSSSRSYTRESKKQNLPHKQKQTKLKVSGSQNTMEETCTQQGHVLEGTSNERKVAKVVAGATPEHREKQNLPHKQKQTKSQVSSSQNTMEATCTQQGHVLEDTSSKRKVAKVVAGATPEHRKNRTYHISKSRPS